MIPDFNISIEVIFLLATIATLIFFYYSNNRPKVITTIISLWAVLHCILAYNGFYNNSTAIPPRFVFLLGPVILIMSYVLLSKHLSKIIDKRNIKVSTFLHTVRIPVEITLYYLFLAEMVPELMTFEGRNFDILAGITAPIIGFLYLKNKISNKILLVWNWICLLLVLFILVNGLLSAELPIQQFAFDQPNKALEYFPFILLPGVVVPIVVYTHITDIIKLRRKIKINT